MLPSTIQLLNDNYNDAVKGIECEIYTLITKNKKTKWNQRIDILKDIIINSTEQEPVTVKDICNSIKNQYTGTDIDTYMKPINGMTISNIQKHLKGFIGRKHIGLTPGYTCQTATYFLREDIIDEFSKKFKNHKDHKPLQEIFIEILDHYQNNNKNTD